MHPTAARLAQRLRERGLEIEVRTLSDSARTAALAAAALGVEVGQIVKSLVFLHDADPAGTPHDVFKVGTEALIAAIPDARVASVS